MVAHDIMFPFRFKKDIVFHLILKPNTRLYSAHNSISRTLSFFFVAISFFLEEQKKDAQMLPALFSLLVPLMLWEVDIAWKVCHLQSKEVTY